MEEEIRRISSFRLRRRFFCFIVTLMKRKTGHYSCRQISRSFPIFHDEWRYYIGGGSPLLVCSSLSHLPACSSVSSFVSVISRSRSVISVPFVSVFFSETRTNNRVARANRIDVRLRKCLVPVANKGKGEWSPSLKENINNTFFCSFFIFLVNTSFFLKKGSTLRFITWRKYHSMILMKI